MKHIVGAVNLSNLYLKEIPEILNGVHVKGDFNVSFNVLNWLIDTLWNPFFFARTRTFLNPAFFNLILNSTTIVSSF